MWFVCQWLLLLWFHLTASDICSLKQNGVSDAVILQMQAAVNGNSRQPSIRRPVYERPVYVVEPPPYVGVGWGYYGLGCGW